MDSVNTHEDWLTTPDGYKLYTKTWEPNASPKARLVFIHGFSDHCNWYSFFFSALAQQDIKVYAFDQRGWGRSVHEPHQKGLTGPNAQVMTDITTFIQSLPKDESKVPLFLMGHSMGGGEVLVYASTGPQEVVGKIRGLLLEAPLIALPPANAPYKATLVLGKLAARVVPQWKLLQKLDPNTMSRDPEICKQWTADPLCHDTGTLEGLAAVMDRTADLDGGRIVLKDGLGEGGKTRIWCAHGTADGACHFDATQRWFDRITVEDKEFRVYDGWYHKLHSEPGDDKMTFANDVAKWVLDRCGPISTEPDGSPKSKL